MSLNFQMIEDYRKTKRDYDKFLKFKRMANKPERLTLNIKEIRKNIKIIGKAFNHGTSRNLY